MTRECHQRLAEILSGFTVDLAGRKPGTIQQDLRLDHDRDNTTLCGSPLRPLRIVNRIHVERCSGSWRSEPDPLGRLYFRERAVSSSTCSTFSIVIRFRAPFCASVIRPVAFSSAKALSTAPNAMVTTGGVWPTATRAAFMAAGVAGKFGRPITANSGFLITSAAFAKSCVVGNPIHTMSAPASA